MSTESFCCLCWERNVLAEHCVSLGKLNIIHQCTIRCSLHFPEKNRAIPGNLKMPDVLLVLLYHMSLCRYACVAGI